MYYYVVCLNKKKRKENRIQEPLIYACSIYLFKFPETTGLLRINTAVYDKYKCVYLA